jgi:hypothetical protein
MPPAPPTTPKPKKGIALPGSPVLWIGVLVIALAGGGYLLWRRSQASSADSGASDVTGAADTADNGDAGQIGTLQSEIGDLQSSETQQADKVQQVQVPNVVGMAQETAYARISAAGLKPSGAPVVPGKTLTVNGQSPAAGALANKGSTVTLQSTVHAVAKPKPKPAPVKKKAA